MAEYQNIFTQGISNYGIAWIAFFKGMIFGVLVYAREAAVELSKITLDFCTSKLGYQKKINKIIRPDGVSVEIDLNEPMTFLGRLVQNDFCILQKTDKEHVLTA